MPMRLSELRRISAQPVQRSNFPTVDRLKIDRKAAGFGPTGEIRGVVNHVFAAAPEPDGCRKT